MSLSEALAEALEEQPNGSITAEHEGARAHVDVVASGPIGVRVKRVTVQRSRDVAVADAATSVSERLGSVLPERVEPVEVDPALGGAVLRTRPEDIHNREYLEVEIRGTRKVDIRRWRVEDEGRAEADWSMTRDQLGRLLDDLE